MKARENQAFLGQFPRKSVSELGASSFESFDDCILSSPMMMRTREREEIMSKKSVIAKMEMNTSASRSVASGHPRVEHLASAAVPCSNVRLDASGTAVIKLPADYDGIALVMLTCESSCEWRIVHSSSSLSASPPTLLQRQLCLTQTFAPESHMSLQVLILLVQVLNLHLLHFISRHQGYLLLVKKCSLSTMLVVSTLGP